MRLLKATLLTLLALWLAFCLWFLFVLDLTPKSWDVRYDPTRTNPYGFDGGLK